MLQIKTPRLAAALALLCSFGCQTPAKSTAVPLAITPAPPALPRLTRAQYENSIHDVLGADLVPPATLEPDVPYDDLYSVGASVAKTSPRGIELYEDGARNLAAQVIAKPERLAALLPCTATSTTDGACLDAFVAKVGGKLWRRALTGDERAVLVATGLQAATKLGGFQYAVSYTLVAMLQSPRFLYRPEVGEPDPEHGGRRLTAFELASRLSYFLWNGPPDDALLAAAQDGSLNTEDGIGAQIDRMMADAKVHRAVRNFADEWLQLRDLLDLNKDPNVYKHFSSDLGASAREETLSLVEYLALDQDADFRELLLTRTTFVDRRLAAIYDIPAVSDKGVAKVEQPPGERIGLLGQVSFLAMRAHPVSSSPTLRGKYVRQMLLCDHVPNPPAGLNTALPEPTTTAKTMRERLTVHMSVPSCANCHRFIDPIGLGFEHFDGIGRFRTTENGETIDTTGALDDAPFADLTSLANDVAQSPKYPACVAQKMFAYAVGRPVTDGEQAQLDVLGAAFVDSGLRLKTLMRAVALSEGFRRIGARDDTVTGATP